MIHRSSALLIACAVALAPVRAAAWCLLGKDPSSYAKYWRTKFPALRIPVYVATDYEGALTWTGLTAAQLEAIVRRTIAVHNETVATPTLYYAGTTDVPLDPDGRMRARPRGIVVDSFTCARVETAPGCAGNQVACTVPGGNTDDLVGKARVTFEPGVCGPNHVAWSIELDQGTDASRTLLHELGHALGLDHTRKDGCPGATDGRGGAGVMNTNLNYWPPYERAWRRDDIEGLRAIYGAEVRHSVHTFADDAFPDAPQPDTRVPLCTAVRTPPTLTGSGSTLLLAHTDAHDRVSLLAWDGEQFVAADGGAVIDPSRHGVSFAPVAVAHDEGDGVEDPVVLVAWSADDSRERQENRLRWARRPLAGGAWQLGYFELPTGATQTSNRVGLGHDPASGRFLVVSTTDRAQLYVITVDRDGGQVATTIFADDEHRVFAFDVGPARCFAVDGAARCTIGYTDGDSRQFWPYPLLTPGWIEVELAADGTAALIAARSSEWIDAHGLVDLAAGADELRGVVGHQRFALVPGEATPVLERERIAAGDWPLRIGSHTVGDELGWRVAARSLVPCGDGQQECEEQCDDGNMCWHAGMACEDADMNGVYASCVPADRGVLQPVARYTELLRDTLSATGPRPVFMLSLTGVPPTAGGVDDLVYHDFSEADLLPGPSWTAPQYQSLYGIGPGCTHPGIGQPLPPGRIQAVCEALDVADDPNTPGDDARRRCCIESLCRDDFDGAFDCLADMLAQELHPAPT